MWIEKEFVATSESSVLLLAAWEELFHGYTPDSYQPRLHNVPSLVDELADFAHYWEREPRNKHHIRKIQEELSATIESELDILQIIPTYLSRCQLLCTAESPQAVISGWRILHEMKSDYTEAFQSAAKSTIDRLPKSKRDALHSVRRLATFAFQDGKEDDDVLGGKLATLDLPPSDVFSELIRIAKPVEDSYRCTLSIVGNINSIHSVARRKGYDVVPNESLSEEYLASFSSNKSHILHVKLPVVASSIRNAAAAARAKVGLDLGFVSLYTNPDSLRLHHVALVASEGQDRTFVQSEQAFRRLKPRTRARLDIRRAVELADSGNLDTRIIAAIEQLALASASYDTRTRFVNLWSALETLAGVIEGSTTLERVNRLLVPLLVSRHVHRRTRYLTILCQKYADKSQEYDFGPGFGGRRLKIEEMLKTLSSPKCDDRIVGLLRFASHPLLRFRVYQAWEKLHVPGQLRKSLEVSQKRLNWHLARIYRGRNLLVHEGVQDRFIVPLLDNLQNYLSTLVQRLVHEVKQHPKWTVRDVVEFWDGRMQHQLWHLRENAQSLTTADFLEDVDPEPLWLS